MNNKVCTLLTYFFAFVLSSNAQTGIPIDVLHYRYEISLTDSSDVIRGIAWIKAKTLGSFSQLSLHLQSVTNKKGMNVTMVSSGKQSINFRQEKNKLHLTFPTRTNEGDTLEIQIQY